MSNFNLDDFSIEPEESEVERNLDQDLINYGLTVKDFTISPYESLNMLDLRDILYENSLKLSTKQKNELLKHDINLLINASMMASHISKVYNFEDSKNIPVDRWWWHLNNNYVISTVTSLFLNKSGISGIKINHYNNYLNHY